jgi:hypothetical protein
MVTAAAAAVDSSAAADATAAADSVIFLCKCLQACHIRHEIFCINVGLGNLWGGGGRHTGVFNLNLDAEWVIMHAYNAWAPSGGTALLDKGTLVALPGHCS